MWWPAAWDKWWRRAGSARRTVGGDVAAGVGIGDLVAVGVIGGDGGAAERRGGLGEVAEWIVVDRWWWLRPSWCWSWAAGRSW